MSKKSNQNPKKHKRLATYRVLATQALSIDVSNNVENLTIQGVTCRIAIKPAHQELAKQREIGGSTLAIEFEARRDVDLLLAARNGFELIEDFVSAIAVVSGTTFAPCEIVQVARLKEDGKRNCEFVQFLPLANRHWHQGISDEKVQSARKLLAHWDGLDNGHRMRRAARRYRSAAGAVDDISAFQEAYIGLEAMEPPLATMAGLTPGSEEISGKCDNCGHQYARKRTTLVGVRALVHRNIDPGKADEEHKKDWKKINSLRNDLTHGLVDENKLKERPSKALIAAMHYLHDAICTCSHSPELLSEMYVLARGILDFIIEGRYTEPSWPALEDWTRILNTSSFKWVRHPDHNLVPEMSFQFKGLKELGIVPGRLRKPFSVATMDDIEAQNYEHD
jgi:hypothetical protein